MTISLGAEASGKGITYSLWTFRGMTEGGLLVCLHVTFKSSWQKGHEECEDMESGGKDMKQVTS